VIAGTVVGIVGAAMASAVGLTLLGGFPVAAITAALLLVVGIANAFFWTYWTLAYLRLRGRTTAAVA
jgi:hypothetical protein